MLRRINKENELEVHIFINNHEYILGHEFFSTNLASCDGKPCADCGKDSLQRTERVDCEFWPGETETYCLDCWVKK